MKDILVCDKDYKFLRRIDDHFANSQILNIHVTSVYTIDELIQDLNSSPFHFIIIGPNQALNQDFNNILTDHKSMLPIIKVIENDSPEILIKYLNLGVSNIVSIDSLLQNFELVLHNVIQFGAFVDPAIITTIKPKLAKIRDVIPQALMLQPKAQSVFELLKKGYSYSKIAEELDMSIDSVRYYIKIIYKKFNVKNKINAINIMKKY